MNVIFREGGGITSDVEYFGETAEEIAALIQKDENEILEYMQTGDDNGVGAFCIRGLMIKKKDIQIIRMKESDL